MEAISEESQVKSKYWIYQHFTHDEFNAEHVFAMVEFIHFDKEMDEITEKEVTTFQTLFVITCFGRIQVLFSINVI